MSKLLKSSKRVEHSESESFITIKIVWHFIPKTKTKRSSNFLQKNVWKREPHDVFLIGGVIKPLLEARFKRRATALPYSIDRIEFDFSTAVARRLKPSRATAV